MKSLILVIGSLLSLSAFAATPSRSLYCEGLWTIESDQDSLVMRQSGQFGDMYPDEQYKLKPEVRHEVIDGVDFLSMTALNVAGQRLTLSCPGLDLTIEQPKYNATCRATIAGERPYRLKCEEI